MPEEVVGKVFISYRRGEDSGVAGRLYDRLANNFPKAGLFMDVNVISPGSNFVTVLQNELAQCDVLLAVIGKSWLDAPDGQGRRRLDNANDFVRIEITSAFQLEKIVIPVLVDKTEMPPSTMLPEPLRPLSHLHAVRLTHERFHADVQELVGVLKAALAAAAKQRVRLKEAEEAEQVLQRAKETEQAALLEHLVWSNNETQGSVQALFLFLALFPKSNNVDAAMARIEELEQQYKENKAWDKISCSAIASELEAFLKVWPKGRHASEAKARFKERQKSRDSIRVFRGHSSKVTSVAISADGCTALSLDSRGSIKLWDIGTGQEIRDFQEPSESRPGHGLTSIMLSPDGFTALSADKNGTMALWDVASGDKLRKFEVHAGASLNGQEITSVAISPNGSSAFSASESGTITLWDFATGQHIRSFDVKGNTSNRSWDLTKGERVLGSTRYGYGGDYSSPNLVVVSPNGEYAASSRGNTLWLFSSNDKKIIRGTKLCVSEKYSSLNRVEAITFTKDSCYLLCGNNYPSVCVWDISNESVASQKIKLTDDSFYYPHINVIAFSFGGSYVLFGGKDNILRLYKVQIKKYSSSPNIEKLDSFALPTGGGITSIAWSPKGDAALAGCFDGTIHLLDLTPCLHPAEG